MGRSGKFSFIRKSTVVDRRAHFQTFGNNFESDGRIKGDEDIQTVTCDQNANTCSIKVPAPGFALVFLKDDVFTAGASPTAFSTTAYTKTANTVSVAAGVLATSNGHKGMAGKGSTSKGSQNFALGSVDRAPGVGMLVALVMVLSYLGHCHFP